ncbi:MAG: hypothetical protein NTZ68_01805 [Candidatus Dependentiae bacterium]|nr:hypothetical protein [Candidatus Dependentiae bacterium]
MKQASKILFLVAMLSACVVHSAPDQVVPPLSEVLQNNLEDDSDPIIIVKVKNNSNATTSTSCNSGSASSNASDQSIKNEKTMGWFAWFLSGWHIDIRI